MNKKRYYWLKLKDDFFRQKEIKKLRRIAGGDTYTIIYLKMLLLAMKTDNKIYFDGIEDDFAEELSLELDEDVNNVQMTLAYLQKQQLIEAITDDEFLLPRCKEMVGSESDSAERVRKHRLNAKKEQKLLHGNIDVTIGNTEIEIDKEIDINNNQIDNIWKLYPLKQGKKKAYNKIPKIIKEIGYDKLIECINNYIKYVDIQRSNGFKTLKYLNGDTFFNGRYEDYLEEVKLETTTVKEEKKEVKYNPDSEFKNLSFDELQARFGKA